MLLAVIILIIIFLGGLYYFVGSREEMTVVGEGVQKNTPEVPATVTFTNFNGKQAIDDQYFYDKVFDNVTYYDNDYDYDTGDLIKTGWEKCTTACSGNCVEYGVFGASYCFPY
jgi:hypothetical protein